MKSCGVILPTKDTIPYFMVDHDIDYIHDNGEKQKFVDPGRIIRFRSKEFKTKVHNDLKFVRKVYYINPEDLPPEVKGRVYIVSKILANLLADYRDDFAYPGTHPIYDGAKIENDMLVSIRRFRLPDQLILKRVM
jgi:hypothetical protein